MGLLKRSVISEVFVFPCFGCSSFASVEEGVELPDFPYSPAVGLIVDAEGASAFRDFIESGKSKDLRAPQDRIGGYAASQEQEVNEIQHGAVETRHRALPFPQD